MTVNKKYNAVFFTLVLGPIILLALLGCIVSDKYFFWGFNCSTSLVTALNILSLLGAIYIVFNNYKSKNHSLFWYLLSGLFSLFLIFNLIVIYSFSNFGF